MAREVKIVVKNVYAPTELQQFILEETVLVKQLKQRVHEQFPGNPLPAHQKLIFGGKICADSDALQKILNVLMRGMCLCMMQNQVQSEESAEESMAVVFHLLVTSVPPRSGSSTPSASAAKADASDQQSESSVAPALSAAAVPTLAPAPTARTLNRVVSTDISSTDRAGIDSPRPTPSNPVASPPALNFSGLPSVANAAPQQQPPATAHFNFPAFGHQVPQAPVPAPHGTHASPAQQQQHHDLLTQGMLMQQQAMILAQIQYLQYLKTHYQQASAQPNGTTLANNASATTTAGVAAHPPAQAQQHQFAQYAQFGHYFGMGMHHPQMYNAMHHPGVHPVGPAAAVGAAGFPHAAHPATTAAPAAANAAAVPRQDGLIVQIAREILPLFDIRLAMKMAFMLFIIGQDTPNDRVLMLALLSFISYLHITGILAKVYEVYKRHYAPPADANGTENRAEDANTANNNNNNAIAGAGRLNGVAAGLARLDFARVLRISSDRGFVQDIKYFLVGFLLSLVPAWHPQPLQGASGAAAPPVQDLPDVAEMPVQGI